MRTAEIIFSLLNLIILATGSCPKTTLNRVALSVPKMTPSIKIEEEHNPTEDMQNFAILETLQRVQLESKDIINILLASYDFHQYQSTISMAQNAIFNVNDNCKNYLTASNDKDRRNTRTQFTKSYRLQLIDTHIRNLMELPEGTPLDAMPPLLSKALKCNMTAIIVFERSYMSSILNGIVLNCIYTDLTGGDTESEVNDWLANMNDSVTGLLRAEKTCMDHYPDYAITDLKEADSVKTLHQTVKEKYTWIGMSATFYAPVRGYQYHVVFSNYSRITNVLLEMTESKNKVMTFCEKKGHNLTYTEDKKKILQRISTYKAARTGDSDPDAAMHILDKIIDTASTFDIFPYAVTIIPDHSSFPIKESITDYCDNEIYLTITYDTVYEDSFWVWDRHTYFDVEYHIRIYLPTQEMGRSTNDLTHTFKVEKNAFWKPTASKIVLISLVLFTVEILDIL